MKRKLVALIFFTILVRQFFVSGMIFPIRIDSGSMVPAFYGPTYRFHCEECEKEFEIGAKNQSNHRTLFACPYCGFMENDLHNAVLTQGTRIILDRWPLSCPVRKLKRFEPIVFRNSEQPTQWVLKRIAALPGESVSFRNGNLLINGNLYRKSLREQEKVIVPYSFGFWFHESTEHEDIFYFDPREPTAHYRSLWNPEPQSQEQFVEQRKEQKPVFFSTRNPYNQSYGAVGEAVEQSDEVFLRFPIRFLECRITLCSKNGKIEIRKESKNRFAIRYNEKTQTALFSAPKKAKNLSVRISLIDETFRFAIGEEVLTEFPLDSHDFFPEKAVVSFSHEKTGLVRFDKSEFEESVQIFLDPYYIAFSKDVWTVPQDHYFVLGDNASISRDSRVWKSPFIAKDAILGIPLPSVRNFNNRLRF